ncbi:AraC family transcriptional regulator [Pseudoxanthomonas sp. LH2527]|uniref:AraC family transcriptional regulator n=1 Tax=Pseudoxanthomonas sp. LH2527 TaxID=2923249 RepID=UPI001F13B5D1|nr:AraC family transcriptional regulator [Pseudoxanthomonas sp. LH2527]MCH6484221.1 AraC family transcriptional regulator [Pseudoxanthomonas sp. LH2527]
MSDPLSDVVRLLRPHAAFSKGISAAGRWAVRYATFGEPSFCIVQEGRCVLAVDGEDAIALETGDFVLLPATPGFLLSDGRTQLPTHIDPVQDPLPDRDVRHGVQDGPPDVRLLGGWFRFEAQEPTLLASLLPTLVHVRGVPRLSQLVTLLSDEADHDRPGRTVVLSRLVDLLLVESLRATPGASAPPGLLRGLADARLASSLRDLHARPAHAWTVAQLAERAALSRSAYFERFTRALGIAPMTYLLAWRMAMARDLLRNHRVSVAEAAEQVGYRSVSTFSMAFQRHTGLPPRRYARQHEADTRKTSASPSH